MDYSFKILEKAEALFMELGVRSVTMDDIARELAISKKTIYHHFKDKNEIVKKVTQNNLDKKKKDLDYVREQSKNVIDELVLLSRFLKEYISNINPSILNELKKFYPEAWNTFQDYQDKVFTEALRLTLKRGVNEGYFRKSINVEVLGILRREEIQMAFDAQVFPRENYDFREVQIELFDHFIHGILTPEGLKLFESYNEAYIEHDKTN